MALIFHVDVRGLIDDSNQKKEDTTKFREGFYLFLKILQRAKCSFSIVIHRCKDFDGLIKMLEKHLDPSVHVSKIPNEMSDGFNLLSALRSQKTRSLLVIQAENKSKKQSPLDGKVPSLPFSWYLAFNSKGVDVVDEKGNKVKSKNQPEMINIYLDLCSKLSFSSSLLFYIIHLPYHPQSQMRKYIRPLDSSDIGKTVTKLRMINHRYYGASALLYASEERWDCGYCFPQCYVLKGIKITALKETKCSFCFKPADKMCNKCKKTFYCTKECQLNDWKFHKKQCQPREKPANKVIEMIVQKIEKHPEPEAIKECYFQGWAAIEDIPSAQDYVNLIQEYENRKLEDERF